MYETELYEKNRIDKTWSKYNQSVREKQYRKNDYLGLVEVSEDTYRVYNKKTGRFYNLMLGIDEVV